MSIEAKVRKEERFALVSSKKGNTAILQTYPTKEDLERGYEQWSVFFTQRKLLKPYPMEFKNGEYRILRNLKKASA